MFLNKKQGKTRITTRLTIRGAKTGQSQRGPINDPHTICDTFSLFSMTFLQKSSVSSADAAVASRPHMPSREGLSGVRGTLTPSNKDFKRNCCHKAVGCRAVLSVSDVCAVLSVSRLAEFFHRKEGVPPRLLPLPVVEALGAHYVRKVIN